MDSCVDGGICSQRWGLVVIPEKPEWRVCVCVTTMTGVKHSPSTYDRMLAEIEMDSDGDEWPATTHRKAPTRKAEAKMNDKEWEHVPPSKAHAMSEEASRDDLSLPGLPKAMPRRASRSHDEIKGDADLTDDSDDDKDTKVRHLDRDAFKDQQHKPHLHREPASDVQHEINDLRVFVSRGPKMGSPTLRCYVERDRQGLNRFNPIYRLFVEDGKHFLLTAQKRSTSKTSNYLLSLSKSPVDRRSPLVIAKLRANWSGSEYTIFDGGLSPSNTAIEASVRNIVGLVEFAYDEMGPGRLNVRIPKVHENGNSSVTWKDCEFHQDHAARKNFEATLDTSALLLRNKRPQYDAQSGGHVLDFHGRVNMPSIKNFQMQSDSHGEDTVLQFGRVSCQPPGPQRQCKCHKDTFTLDLRHPLSPVQAFAICLATLDAKVADAKAYDSVTRILRRMSS